MRDNFFHLASSSNQFRMCVVCERNEYGADTTCLFIKEASSFVRHHRG